MHTSRVDRRTSGTESATGSQQDTTHIVQHGILIQALVGTRGAVEFLKMRNIPSAIIHRVLTRENIRIEDYRAAGQGTHQDIS